MRQVRNVGAVGVCPGQKFRQARELPLFILASKSERRTQILKSCGIKHKVFVTGVKEVKGEVGAYCNTPLLVIENARRKALAAVKHFNEAIILGVDTVVLFKGKNIGKPKNLAQAKRMLEAFSGERIAVYTGLCLLYTAKNKDVCGVEKTILKVKDISKKDLNKYFLRLGPYDRAGGFSIEGPGAIIFDNLKGSYFNVLGLPMKKLAELFNRLGLDILDFME